MRSGKRTILWLLGAALVGLAAGFGTAGANGPVRADAMGDFSYFASPKPVPPISFQDGSGRTLTLADFKGRVVLVNFWATWCGPCVEEMPSLDRLQAKLGSGDFTVLDISLDRQGKDAVTPFFSVNKLTHLRVYLDPRGQAFQAWHGEGVPTSFLIGRDGRARGLIVGPADWDSPASLALIERAIAEGKDGAKTKSTDRAAPAPAPLG